jgi:TM2 domain-containing membrane protein YozV
MQHLGDRRLMPSCAGDHQLYAAQAAAGKLALATVHVFRF